MTAEGTKNSVHQSDAPGRLGRDHHGYVPLVNYDLRAGGKFQGHPNEGMKRFPGIPDVIIDGEVVAKTSYSSARCRGEVECFAGTRKHISLGDTTGVTRINGGAQGSKLRFILLLLALQSPQRRAHHLAGVLVTAAFYLLQDEAIKFVSKIDVTGWHVNSEIRVP